MSDSNCFLVLTDIDSIQSYLFSSVRLAMIAGASRIVVEFDDYVKKESGGEVLTYSGGSAIVRFDDLDVARNFCRDAEKKFRTESVSGHLTTIGPIEYEPSQFKQALARGYAELEVKKRLGFASGESISHAMGRRCATCGQEAATEFKPHINPDTLPGEQVVADAANWYGPACHAKWKAYRSRAVDVESDRHLDWIDWLRESPDWSRHDPGSQLPSMISDFVSERERLALIVADVNGVGERRLDLNERELKRFSEGLSKSLRCALVAAICAACEPYRATVLADEQPLPLIVLYHGGDDLVVACRDKLALTFIRELTDEFKNQNNVVDDEGKSWNDGRPLGLSACAVVSGRGFPFRTSHRIASRLLAEAKKAAREQVRAADGVSPWQHGAVDLAIVSESHASPQAIMADRGKIDGDEQFHFTGRPYCVGDGSRRSFRNILAATEVLRQFPKSRLHELRKICSFETLSKGATDDRDLRVSDLLDDWQGQYRDWLRRTNRNPLLQRLWLESAGGLEIEAGSGLLEKSDSEHRTAVGDFAELIGLIDTVEEFSRTAAAAGSVESVGD